MDTLDFDLATFMLGRHETEQELAFNLKFSFGEEDDKLNVFFPYEKGKRKLLLAENFDGQLVFELGDNQLSGWI